MGRCLHTWLCFMLSAAAWLGGGGVILGPGDGGLDELLVQYDEARNPWWLAQDAGLDVIAQFDLGGSGGTAFVVGEWTYDAYGQVAGRRVPGAICEPHAGHKGLFFDRLDAQVVDEFSYQETPRLVTDAVGHYHVRNRVLSPKLGRWLQANPNATGVQLLDWNGYSAGKARIPTSVDLNRRFNDGVNLYSYVRYLPVGRSDPLGLFTQRDGYAVEREVLDLYQLDHPGCYLFPGNKACKLFDTILKPDILNLTESTWLEIKPLSPSGVATAVAQFNLYSLEFSQWGVSPDRSWQPSSRVIYANGKPFEVDNMGGILFYADAWDVVEDGLAIGATALAATAIQSSAAHTVVGQWVIGMLAGGEGGALGLSMAGAFGADVSTGVAIGSCNALGGGF